MEIDKTIAAIEAVLFASGEPISLYRLSAAVGVEEETVFRLIPSLRDKYQDERSGIFLVEADGEYQLCSKEEFAANIKSALEIKRDAPLSAAAMEILAIIAYNQPVTKAFIEQVRGVDSSQTVNNLVEKRLVEEAGRLELPGRPVAYKTTANFLRSFGFKSIDNLPPLPDESGQLKMGEVLGEDEVAPAAEAAAGATAGATAEAEATAAPAAEPSDEVAKP